MRREYPPKTLKAKNQLIEDLYVEIAALREVNKSADLLMEYRLYIAYLKERLQEEGDALRSENHKLRMANISLHQALRLKIT